MPMLKVAKRRRPAAAQRRAMAAATVVQVALLLAAQVDLLRRTDDEVRGPKWAWRLATLVNFVGPLAYFVFGRRSATSMIEG